MKMIYTITIKSEVTGRIGSKTIELDLNPEGMLEKFYDAVDNCLYQIAGEGNGKSEEGGQPN